MVDNPKTTKSKLKRRVKSYVIYPSSYTPENRVRVVEKKTLKAALEAAYEMKGRYPVVAEKYDDLFFDGSRSLYTHCEITIFTRPK